MGILSSISGLNEWLMIIIIIILLIVWVIIGPIWMLNNATKNLIQMLKKNNATTDKKAMSLEQLGIHPINTWDTMFRMKDYKPEAIQKLIETQILTRTQDSKYFINEEIFNRSKYKNL